MPPSLRASAASGWLPASLLGLVAVVVLVGYGTPLPEILVFAAYVAFGVAVPGMLWVRFFAAGRRIFPRT